MLEFADLLKSYGIRKVTGDRYGGEWPRERFRLAGISYELSTSAKSDLYREMLPLLNSGKIELLDHTRLVSQLCGLERRTARGGRDSSIIAPGHDDSPTLSPEPQCLRWMQNAGFSSLATKSWRGHHDRRTIHGHRHTEHHCANMVTSNIERTNRVTDQSNDPHSSGRRMRPP